MSHVITPHHIGLTPELVAGNGGRGRIVFLPGSPSRARQLSERMEEVVEVDNSRRYTAYLGKVRDGDLVVDVAAVPTGMGCPSVNVIVTELLELGATRLLRVGTTGTLQPSVKLGDLVIATGAVRDESTSDVFVPRDVPAVAHHDWVVSLGRAAADMGLGQKTWAGLVHTKDSLYGREFPSGPLKAQHTAYMQMLAEAGVLATEMESSHLFVLAQVRNKALAPVSTTCFSPEAVKAGTVLAVIGDPDHGFGPADIAAATESQACDLAVAAAIELMRMEGPVQ